MSTFLSRRQLIRGAPALAAASLIGCRSEVAPHATLPEARDISLVVQSTPTVEGAGVHLRRTLPVGHTAFIYVLDGAIDIGASPTTVPAQNLVVLGPGALFRARGASSGGRILLLAASPIGEPVARRGPFVMNTEEELDQAVSDYQTGRLTEI